MKKLLMVAAISTAALAATPLLADQAEHRHGQGSATQGGPGAGHEHGARHAERHAEMQKRMQERHGRMAARGHGEGHGAQGGTRGEHQHRGEGCPMNQPAPKA